MSMRRLAEARDSLRRMAARDKDKAIPVPFAISLAAEKIDLPS